MVQQLTDVWKYNISELSYIGIKKNLRKKVLTEISKILNQYHSNPIEGHNGIKSTLAKIFNIIYGVDMYSK